MNKDHTLHDLVRRGTALLEQAVLIILHEAGSSLYPHEVARRGRMFCNTIPGRKTNALTQGVLDALEQAGLARTEQNGKKRRWYITEMGTQRLHGQRNEIQFGTRETPLASRQQSDRQRTV